MKIPKKKKKKGLISYNNFFAIMKKIYIIIVYHQNINIYYLDIMKYLIYFKIY